MGALDAGSTPGKTGLLLTKPCSRSCVEKRSLAHSFAPSRPMTPTAIERAAREIVLASLEQEIGQRIRPVVAHLPEPEIRALIQRMALIQYKYEGDRPARRLPETPRAPT
jgi:hypothetical protein